MGDDKPVDAAGPAPATAAQPTRPVASDAQEAAAAPFPGPELAEFPRFVAGPRRLPPDDVLFEAGNLERELLAKQAAWREAKDEAAHAAQEQELHDRALSSYLTHKFECATCHTCLPTHHLLDIHVSEVHDAFFAAQAARCLPVFLCLVEGCGRKFCTAQERKQHLVEHHRFPKGRLGLDRIHLRRKTGQIRVLPSLRKSAGDDKKALEQQPRAGSPQPMATVAAEDPEGGAGTDTGPADMEEDVVQGFSRLNMAAQTSSDPPAIRFGRRSSGRGLPGSAGRGRGRRGAQKEHARMNVDT